MICRRWPLRLVQQRPPAARPRRRREATIWAVVFAVEVLVILGFLAHATASRMEIAWRDPANILIVPSR